MIFNRTELHIEDIFNIKINKDAFLRLEDAQKANRELLLTIDASHLGMRNGNGTLYRHDTIQNDFGSFIYPSPKPVIERHNQKKSEIYGRVVGVDYQKTKFYDEFSSKFTLEDLTTKEYMSLAKNEILPYQKRDPWYNGLGFLQLASKITHKDGIDKILSGEFSNVSIGASPIRLVCSECGQDQVEKMCNHFALKGNDIFMLAESLEYEELSFVPRGADPFGRVSKIHDEEVQEAEIGIISVYDFYKIAEGKTMICVDNICKICDQEEEMALRKTNKPIVSVSYSDEFGAERVGTINLGETEESISLADEDKAELKDNQFAIIQTNDTETKRRFPLNSKANTIAALALFDEAQDLTEQERERATIALRKAAKKFDITITDAKTEETQEETQEDTQLKDQEDTIETLTQKLIDKIALLDSDEKLQDFIGETEKPKPMAFVFNVLSSLGRQIKWAGDDLMQSVDGFLQSLGKLAIEKGTYDSLNSELTEVKDELTFKDEEITLLDKQNVELNHLVRISLVDSIIDSKKSIGKLEDEQAEHSKLMGFTYESLREISGDLKSVAGTKHVVNNNKNINKIQDPTLLDEDTTDGTTEEVEIKVSKQELVQGFKNLFRK
jgi:hypothetical protein